MSCFGSGGERKGVIVSADTSLRINEGASGAGNEGQLRVGVEAV